MRTFRWVRFLGVLLGLCIWFAQGVLSLPALVWGEEPAADGAKIQEEKQSGSKFMRILSSDEGEPEAMQTAIVRYRPTEKDSKIEYVDLIGVVHIGEKNYYDTLNKEFEQYDSLLYELVAPKDAKPEPGAKSAHPVSMLQRVMKETLQLAFQLDQIDYESKNFVHADMTPGDFSKSMEKRGESLWKIFFRAMGQSMAMSSAQATSNTPPINPFLFFSDKTRGVAMKRQMALQFDDLEQSMSLFEGPDGSTIITERNKVALDVLKKEVEGEKRKIGIFYGAGHMPDMEKRLLELYPLQAEEPRWLTAWDLRFPENSSPPKAPAKPKRKKLGTDQ